MDGLTLVLHVAVFAAALLQAATGIGFGVIAGPVILMVMGSGAAIQVTIVLSLLIAVVLAPSLYKRVDRRLMVHFLVGTIVGLPLGILVFVQVSLDLLKLLAGLAVLLMAAAAAGLFRSSNQQAGDRQLRFHEIGIGVLSGAMSTSLAMPGPVAAAWMSGQAYSKDTIRATILVLFVFTYTAAIAIQAGSVGVTFDTVELMATLTPATLVGILLGRLSVAWISERTFRWLIIVLLVATSLSLLVNAFLSFTA